MALSFGKEHDVNIEIAKRLEETLSKNNDLPVFAQWEIFDLIKGKYKNLKRMGDKRYRYLTTAQIIDKFHDKFVETYQAPPTKIALFAQSWHAPRCMVACKNKGIEVVLGEFIDKFSPNDSQPWVRDVLSWVIKEAQK
ncbi:MAG: hypothetical protein HC831_10195 [Chloroflexia bacterium]|nr:hypothetical protein [Chloroflexia bacterium]